MKAPRVDFGSNYVVFESPNLMDFRLSTANTTGKLKSIIGPTTIFERFTNGSNWLAYRHGIEEAMVERVKEAKAFSD